MLPTIPRDQEAPKKICMKKLRGENLESELFATWLRYHGYKFTHIPNESGLPAKFAMIVAMRKKRM